jgi:hypothetical protein
VRVDVFDQMQLSLRRADDQYFSGAQQNLGNTMEIVFVQRRAAIAQRTCARVQLMVWVVWLYFELLDIVRAEVDDMGLDMVDPNDGVVMGHRTWRSL